MERTLSSSSPVIQFQPSDNFIQIFNNVNLNFQFCHSKTQPDLRSIHSLHSEESSWSHALYTRGEWQYTRVFEALSFWPRDLLSQRCSSQLDRCSEWNHASRQDLFLLQLHSSYQPGPESRIVSVVHTRVESCSAERWSGDSSDWYQRDTTNT